MVRAKSRSGVGCAVAGSGEAGRCATACPWAVAVNYDYSRDSEGRSSAAIGGLPRVLGVRRPGTGLQASIVAPPPRLGAGWSGDEGDGSEGAAGSRCPTRGTGLRSMLSEQVVSAATRDEGCKHAVGGGGWLCYARVVRQATAQSRRNGFERESGNMLLGGRGGTASAPTCGVRRMRRATPRDGAASMLHPGAGGVRRHGTRGQQTCCWGREDGYAMRGGASGHRSKPFRRL